jgi:ribosomal-protein-alanine N-acetyltransferase
MILLKNLPREDWQQAVQIHAQCFPDPWNQNDFKDILQQKGMVALGAYNNDSTELVGFCFFQHLFEVIDIITLCIMPYWQNKGIGTQILNYIFALSAKESIDKVILEVRENNSMALAFYTKLGFKQCRIRRRYYSNSDNAIVMAKVFTV